MFEIDKYLQNQGLRDILPPDRYWKWARKKVGVKNFQKFIVLMEKRSTDLSANSRDIYDFLAEPDISSIAGSFEYRLLKEILIWVTPKLPADSQILEIGCHTGVLTRYYAKYFPNAQFIGIDSSPKAIDVAKKLAEKQNLSNISFYVGNILDHVNIPEISSDCIITGRVFGELMTPLRRMRKSWEAFDYHPKEPDLDKELNLAVATCSKWLKPDGKFLVTERFSDFDRLNRMIDVFIENDVYPDRNSLTPIAWSDVVGDHRTWFFEANNTNAHVKSEKNLFLPPNVPIPSNETEAVGSVTRIMLDGLIAWQTWRSLSIDSLLDKDTLRWPRGEVIHYELGLSKGNLGFAFIASNTDIFMLTLFLPQEMSKVNRDIKEYIAQLKQTGAR